TSFLRPSSGSSIAICGVPKLRISRNSPQALKQMPILTPMKQQITLGDVADINVVSGPTMLKTENARPASWIYVDARGRDMVSVVNDIKTAISEKV
ncbi:efflux RND transporter permease subunit, partial [Klebsiella pneumoniae]|uniref:efflux RND transporter permease subunit n=1 Tax=Klebsiella pneumoniae TaxID=573 RepID=UPI00272FC80C